MNESSHLSCRGSGSSNSHSSSSSSSHSSSRSSSNSSCFGNSSNSSSSSNTRTTKSRFFDRKETSAAPERLRVLLQNGASTVCAICLEIIITHQRATLDGCIHEFCFTCIERWGKVTSSCPCCKAAFTTATCGSKTFVPPPKAPAPDEDEYDEYDEYDEDDEDDPVHDGEADVPNGPDEQSIHGYDSDDGFIVVDGYVEYDSDSEALYDPVLDHADTALLPQRDERRAERRDERGDGRGEERFRAKRRRKNDSDEDVGEVIIEWGETEGSGGNTVEGVSSSLISAEAPFRRSPVRTSTAVAVAATSAVAVAPTTAPTTAKASATSKFFKQFAYQPSSS
jgi:hypothetical protein